jgi:hypothetical protein
MNMKKVCGEDLHIGDIIRAHEDNEPSICIVRSVEKNKINVSCIINEETGKTFTYPLPKFLCSYWILEEN